MSSELVVKKMMDRQAITDQIYRYCRAMDRMDHGLGYSIWHDDGEADYGTQHYQGSGRGFVDWACESHGRMETHSHQVSNILIEIDGDQAGSETYVTANLRLRDGDKLMNITAIGRYIDRWSCRDSRWAIDKRIFIQDFNEVREVAGPHSESGGSRDREDASYSVLSL